MNRPYVVVGPARHGVVAHALRLADASPRLSRALVRVEHSDDEMPGRLADLLGGVDGALLQVTDRLFGADAGAAADVLVRLAGVAPLAVVLHDVPQPGEGEGRLERRRSAYGRIAVAARHVVVSSEHERALLSACVTDAHDRERLLARTTVLPLPVERAADLDSATGADGLVPLAHSAAHDIGVLGFVYPGKGVDDVIDAAAVLRRRGHDVGVTNYGAAADGHADVVDTLHRRADAVGVPFAVTGYLPEPDLVRALQRTDVPTAAHRHISASGSVGTWLSVGRRAVVTRGAWVAELEQRHPGSVVIVDSLVDGLEPALRHPDRTRLATGVRRGASWADTAAAHVLVLEAL